MKRIVVVTGLVLGIAVTPTIVAASGSSAANADRYRMARNVSSPVGPLYGPVQVSSSSYAFITK